ncbi:MAG TPA: hypothetical protein VKQ08_09980 [Cyclobacteriaceae bacterium]|nr:hypothetical protein [Cyclobacteriaceae bacterium]
MKVILIGALSLLLLWELILLSRDIYIRRKFRKLTLDKYKLVAPLVLRLAANEEIPGEDLLQVARDPALRCGLFKMLEAYDKAELFPALYLTLEKGAEGYLVNWLEFPTELGNAPDEIEILALITHESDFEYYAFKYRSQLPRWARQRDWMIGISGPYQKNSRPYDVPVRVFSRFNPVGSISPEMEVEWVHRNINPSMK